MPGRRFGPCRSDRDLASGSMTHLTIEPSILYVGTPVALLSTANGDGTINLAPMSSAWALDDVVVLGLGASGQTAHNLRHRPELVINFPSPAQWEAVERLAGVTGRDPVPEHKRDRFRFEREKFAAAGLTPVASELVGPPRVAECPLQFEATAVRHDSDAGGSFLIVQAQILRVHADHRVVVPGTSHVDPAAWSPLIYNFRHYFGLGSELGESFRTETPGRDARVVWGALPT
jgi:flavin reductase (DIM6/NTAB) family NADH-FMN oxidoreductase RutF